MLSVHRHPAEKCTENIVELLKLVVLLAILLSILRSGPFLLRPETIIMRSFFNINQNRVGIRYFFEYLFGSWMNDRITFNTVLIRVISECQCPICLLDFDVRGCLGNPQNIVVVFFVIERGNILFNLLLLLVSHSRIMI